MNDIFLMVLTLSISGSLVLLLLLLLRPLLQKRTSKTWQYYIWIVVILRLLVPFAPEHNLMEIVDSRAEAYATASQDSVGLPANAPPPFLLTNAELPDTPVLDGEESGSRMEAVTVPSVDFIGLAVRIWLIVAIVLFLRKLLSYHLFVHRAKAWCTQIQDEAVAALYREVCGELGIRRPPALVRSSNLAAPALLGALRPVVALPDTDLEYEHLRHILRHELTHHRRLDIAYKWLVQTALCLHWFNPLVHLLSREINRLCELSCDEVVIRILDKAGMRAYGDMLLDCIQAGIVAPTRAAVSITLCEDKKLVKERLASIMQYSKKSKLSIAASTVLAVALFLGASFTGVYGANKPEVPSAADANSPATDRGEIVKTLSGGGIQNIEIYAELCILVVEPSDTGQFEVVFSYPETVKVNYENHFNLGVSQNGNTIAISTDYENQRWDTSFEEIDGFDSSRYPSESVLTVKVPQKQYAALHLNLNCIGSILNLSGVDASALNIYNATGNLTVRADRAFDNLSFENNVGNITLQIPALGSQLNVSNRVGHFVLALPAEPSDISLAIRDMSGNGYDVNSFLPDSWIVTRGNEADSFQRGAGSNRVDVGLTDTSGFEVRINGFSNLQ